MGFTGLPVAAGTSPDGAMESPDGEIEPEAVTAGAPSICPTIDDGAGAERDGRSDEQDPFAGGAETGTYDFGGCALGRSHQPGSFQSGGGPDKDP